MKKMVLASFMATALLATDNQDFVHFSVGNAKLTGSTSTVGASADFDTDGTQYTLGLGHYYGDSGRVYAAYTYIDRETGVDKADAFSLGYDFLLPVSEKTFSLYAGPVIGYTRYEEPGIDLSGFHYGGQVGALIRITENIEIDGGYRYVFETGSQDVSILGVNVNVDADDVKMWYVGANYRF
jgi:hypothetical protein